jgi:hypothetical protein
MDPMPGFNWVPEPHTKGTFMHNDKLHVVSGCFRHKVYKRFSSSGEPFIGFTCSECCNISQVSDFRMRVVCEDVNLEKWGKRSIGLGRRLGYLSNAKLAAHSHSLGKRLNHEKLKVWYHKKKVAQLQITQPNLKDISHEWLNRKDVMWFCQNIVAAHWTGASGGKPALWDFFRDVAQNLNMKKAGHWYSKNTKLFAQAMKIFGGRRMCDLFTLNYASPNFRTIKRQNQKGVHFKPGEHASIFKAVAEIYKTVMEVHGVGGIVLVILAEDETKVKQRISWEPKYDTLAGFCGPKSDHSCISDYKPVVGVGDEGYNMIVDSLRSDKMDTFAHVIVMNPLYVKLPRLVLSHSCTCNCFDSEWVKEQWKRIEELWQVDCECAIGPIIGHASDGDSRKQQLMLSSHTCADGQRYGISWPGWVMSGIVTASG